MAWFIPDEIIVVLYCETLFGFDSIRVQGLLIGFFQLRNAMSYSQEFATDEAVYRIFYTNHVRVTKEDIINYDRIKQLHGIVLEVTGDRVIKNKPENAIKMYAHSNVVEIVKSLGTKGPTIFVVDVHMDFFLKDVWIDFFGWLTGVGFAASGAFNLLKSSIRNITRLEFLTRILYGVGAVASMMPLGTLDKLAMFVLQNIDGEIADGHPLKWNYGDCIVPDMVIGRDAITAWKVEEGIIPLLRKEHGNSGKLKIDIHYGAGHVRMSSLIQDKRKRDTLLEAYSKEGFSDFEKRHLNQIFAFRYNPDSEQWIKQEHFVLLYS